jgi:capsular polysaccharide transport system ATP-binding protein
MIRIEHVTKTYAGRRGRHVVLNDVSVDVPRGSKLALLGRNGAGKSTLIRIFGKVELPDSGRVVHDMSVSWPLGFSGSFQGSLSGLDNVRFIARIYQADYERLRAFVDDFAELGDFLYQPVKTYSSGMRARLAFALSIAIDFDCYLIDEVVMVGDQRFHARCRESLFDRQGDTSLVLASHDVHFVREVCTSALILQRGRADYYPDIDEALNVYAAL